MILDKVLILKGLAGVTALGSAVTVGVGHMNNWWRESIDPALKELVEKVGLGNCKKTANTTECSIDSTGLKVQHDSTKEEGKTKSSGSGKIKVYKLSGENTEYKDNFKFVIEGGDINLTNGTASGSTTITKLEQFETYEIKEEGEDSSKKWYFSRKKKAGKNIKDSLGLPSICTLVDTVTCTDVEVSTTDIASMKFDGLTTGQTPSISANAKLTVTKLSTSDTDYPLDYKFELKGKDTDATLNLGSKQITLKSTKATEFKIKGTTASNLSLEKAWTAKSLGEKVGLICTESSSTDKSCTLKDGSINVNNVNNGNGKIEGAKVKEGSTGKKITYLENQADYNQGIKFTVEGGTSITLTKDENASTTLNIENNSATYEIKKDSSDSKWYLTKYTAAR